MKRRHRVLSRAEAEAALTAASGRAPLFFSRTAPSPKISSTISLAAAVAWVRPRYWAS